MEDCPSDLKTSSSFREGIGGHISKASLISAVWVALVNRLLVIKYCVFQAKPSRVNQEKISQTSVHKVNIRSRPMFLRVCILSRFVLNSGIRRDKSSILPCRVETLSDILIDSFARPVMIRRIKGEILNKNLFVCGGGMMIRLQQTYQRTCRWRIP